MKLKNNESDYDNLRTSSKILIFVYKYCMINLKKNIYEIMMKKVVRILSIDGGGVRGVIPAVLLAEIEKRTGKSIAELFDLIAGTSTGGIIALGLTASDQEGKPRYSAQDLVDFYMTKLNKIFKITFLRKIFFFISYFRPKYSPSGFEKNVEALVGRTKISEALTEVLIPAYEIESRETFFFKSRKVKNDEQEDFYMADVARATSSAPTFFPPAEISPVESNTKYYFVDGSTFASDPAMCAYAEAKSMHPEMKTAILVSLGTGSYTKPIPFKKAKNWGTLFWAVPILNIVFDAMPNTVEYELKKILNVQAIAQQYFFRLQVELDSKNDSLDDSSPANLAVIKSLADKLITEQTTLIDEICRILTDKTIS